MTTDKIIGYTQGTFDLFHVGHLHLLQEAKKRCDELIVGVNSDELVLMYKFQKPVISDENRAEVLRALKCVDQVIITETLDKTEMYHQLHFNKIFIGDDWKGNERWQKTEQEMEALGVELVYLPYTKGISSTQIKTELKTAPVIEVSSNDNYAVNLPKKTGSGKKINKWIRKFKKNTSNKGLLSSLKLFSHLAWWRLFGERAAADEIRHPQKVDENKIVFEAYGEYSDNSRTLYEHMIAAGYDKKYDIVWIVDDPEKYKHLMAPSTRLVRRKYDNDRYTLESLREIHSAKYIFYTVAVNWAGTAQKGQLFVNLWHGCSFKGNKNEREVFFDYCLVPSPFFVNLKQNFFKRPSDCFLPLGYPRYDIMLRENKNVSDFVKKHLDKLDCKKMVLWMPTYRKSTHSRINEHSLDASAFNLPIVYSAEDMMKLNSICSESRILLLIKRHRLHSMGTINNSDYSNIEYIDDSILEERNIQLYELLHEADALVTDYSSVGVDFLLLDRPVGYTLDDFKAYKESRGFTVENPLEYMPGEYICNMEDFIKFLHNVENDVDPKREQRKEITQLLHVKSENYCKDLLDRLNI